MYDQCSQDHFGIEAKAWATPTAGLNKAVEEQFSSEGSWYY